MAEKVPNQPRSATDPRGEMETIEEITVATGFRGPLPHPVVFGAYDKVLPGSADRILKMAENEQDHRHGLERRRVNFIGFSMFLGQLFAFSIGIGGVAGGVYLVAKDKGISGFAVFFTSLATLVGIYLNQQAKRSSHP